MAEASVPKGREWVLDTYFIEHRARLLDVAAFLDRIDRAGGEDVQADPRVQSLQDAIGVLIDGKGDRARRILELLSDPTSELLDQAPGKGAMGVWPAYGKH